jgi:hypothetical protein
MASLIAIKDKEGNVRYMQSPARLKLGDEVLGHVRYNDRTHQPEQQTIQTVLSHEGIKWGDAIAWATSKVGIKGCAPCKANQELYNQSLKLGLQETARRIKAWLS